MIYIGSDSLPFTLVVDEDDLEVARTLVRRWMAESLIFSIEAGEGEPQLPPAVEGMMINFGTISMLTVTDVDLAPEKLKVPLDNAWSE